MKLPPVVITLLAALVGSAGATAASPEKPSELIEIRFDQHHFTPERVEVAAGVPLTLKVVNASKERIEFESFKLDREKVVEPGHTLVLHLPALRPDSYDFYDDFHSDVPEGTIVAR